MRVYIVRHGETGDNAKKLYMGSDSPLSDIGKKQAQTLAERFKEIPVDFILSSPYERAKQTAETIKEATQKELEFDDDLKEISRPSKFHGRSWNEPEIKEIRDMILEKWHDKDWHYADEENFNDLLVRSLRLITKLESLNHENILLVTHEGFMKMLVAAMMFGKNLNHKLFDELYNFLSVKNTGITVVEKIENWKLITWNDHAHLG